MRKLAVILSTLVFVASSSSAWASLYSGSLSTSILFNDSAYPVQPYGARVPISNPPGGLTATAAWDQYGMRLDWKVTNNGNGTYTYKYDFGAGWYPETQPVSGSTEDPYIANKNLFAWDIQVGAGITGVNQLSDVHWTVYQFDGKKIGSGSATHWDSYVDPDTGNPTDNIVVSSDATVLRVANLSGKTGHKSVGYTTQSLFHGLQWMLPRDDSFLPVWNTNVNYELIFTTTFAPGLGNFFANSDQTKSNNDYSEVVAFDGTFDATGKSIASWSNRATVPGGIPAPVPVPPSVLLFGSGISGLFFLARKKIAC